MPWTRNNQVVGMKELLSGEIQMSGVEWLQWVHLLMLTYVEEAKTAREMMKNLTDAYTKVDGKNQYLFGSTLG